jgi:putative membrane protein
MTFQDLPLLNAILNSLTVVLLTAGYIQIRRGQKEAHRKLMITAFVVSSLFLAGYLVHKFTVGPKLFPMQGWPRVLYLSILLPHTILAMLNLPFILAALWFAFTGKFDRHKRITRWLWPSWMFVSITGVLVYLMLYRWFV